MSTEEFRQDIEEEREAPRLVPAIPDVLHDGKDELNFAEFPLGTVDDRTDKEKKTLVYEDKIWDASKNEYISRKLTVTGADAYGLPTAIDEEVLLGLVQLSKLQRFESKVTYFSRYQLARLLGWPINGQSYARIEQALKRWLGVSLYYVNAWRDKATNTWGDEGFHILDNVKIDLSETERSRPKPSPEQTAFEFAASSFTWNSVVYRSFQQGNLKALDFAFVMKLRSAITKKLYRFLDKRFFHGNVIEQDLRTLAFEKIGISRNTATGDLKRKIRMAVRELEEHRFLKPLPEDRLFTKVKAGVWRVTFEKASAVVGEPDDKLVPAGQGSLPIEADIQAVLSPLEEKLAACGVSAEKVRQLAASHPPEFIEEKIEVLNWLVAKKDSKVSQNPSGFLIRSIEGRFETPRNFETPEKRREKEDAKAKRAEALKAREQRRAERDAAKEKAKQDAIAEFWGALSEEARKRAEQEAFAKAERFEVEIVERGGAMAKAARQGILDKYALSVLSQG